MLLLTYGRVVAIFAGMASMADPVSYGGGGGEG